MRKPVQYEYPEPVPSVSQSLALPFVAAVAGYLVSAVGCGSVRVTLHRIMTRDAEAYLQQICSYAGAELDHGKAGRIFIVDEGIIGKAFAERAIVRTGRYDREDDWWADYRADRAHVGDTRKEPDEPISYLAVPFLGPSADEIVGVLYVEAGGLNLFVEGSRLEAVLGMAAGYCDMLDGLVSHPLARIRNYPLPAGSPVGGTATLYPTLQEVVEGVSPPRLARLSSYNFAPAP